MVPIFTAHSERSFMSIFLQFHSSMPYFILLQCFHGCYSTAEACKDCARCGKNWYKWSLWHKDQNCGRGHVENFLLLFVHQCGCLRQRHFTEKENPWKNFNLTSWIKRNKWKELTKLIQNHLGTIDWINRCWDIWPGKYAKTAERAESASQDLPDPLNSLVILNKFLELSSAVEDSKNLFLRNFDFMVKSL